MNRFIFALLLGLASTAHAQDAVQTVLRAAPQLVAFAGSPENFYSLVIGLTEGTPAQLGAPAADGFRRVTTFSLRTRLSPEQAAAVLERARQDLELLGIPRPTPEQLAAVLTGGVLDTPTGRTQVRGVLPQGPRAELRSELAPDPNRPSADERAFARLPTEIQSLLAGMPPREALMKVDLAQQHLIAVGAAYTSPERIRAMLQNLLAPQAGVYSAASASATSFPPISPLISPYVPVR
jgi:hypothetical protein